MGDAMDMDIDLGEDEFDYGQMQQDTTAAAPDYTTTAPPDAPVEAPVPEAYRDDFDSDFPVKEKIHIDGLEGLAQPLVLEYIQEYVPHKIKRLEWIDDSSANIIFLKTEDAADALLRLSFTSQNMPPSLEPRLARPFSQRPDHQFTIRQSRVSDKKKPGAKDRSEFYLRNPEWDPENRRNDRRGDRRGGRKVDGYVGRGGDRRNDRRDNGPYVGRDTRRSSDMDDPRARRNSRPEAMYTEDMYEDAPAGQGFEEGELVRRMSSASVSTRNAHDSRRGSRQFAPREDVFRDRMSDRRRNDTGRLRDRSRSPERSPLPDRYQPSHRDEGDGRYGFAEEAPRRQTARRRSTPPPPRNALRDDYDRRYNIQEATPPPQKYQDNGAVELFPNHSEKRSRELFPHKTAHSNHRRNNAMDREDTREILTPTARSFAERMTGGPQGPAVRGRGNVNEDRDDIGFSIRGAGANSNGFSIKGAAGGGQARALELFPDRVRREDNKGRELFPGRGGDRRRAEDFDY